VDEVDVGCLVVVGVGCLVVVNICGLFVVDVGRDVVSINTSLYSSEVFMQCRSGDDGVASEALGL